MDGLNAHRKLSLGCLDASNPWPIHRGFGIANQNGLWPVELDRANPGRNLDALKAGDRVLVPKPK